MVNRVSECVYKLSYQPNCTRLKISFLICLMLYVGVKEKSHQKGLDKEAHINELAGEWRLRKVVQKTEEKFLAFGDEGGGGGAYSGLRRHRNSMWSDSPCHSIKSLSFDRGSTTTCSVSSVMHTTQKKHTELASISSAKKP